jgi:hypothetical protein
MQKKFTFSFVVLLVVFFSIAILIFLVDDGIQNNASNNLDDDMMNSIGAIITSYKCSLICLDNICIYQARNIENVFNNFKVL